MWKNRVLWCEGQFLRPQHFQQQERFIENALDARLGATDPYPFGFTDVEIDRGALSRGVIQLNHASGVLPDGTPFSFPDGDPPPAPLSIGTDVKDRLVLLAAPLSRPGVPSASFDPIGTESLARYESAEVDVVDVNEGFPEPTMIQIARLRPRLLLAGQADGAYATLGVCRLVERRADGQLELDRDYVAPTLHVGCAAGLSRWLTELRGLLAQRAETMAMRLAEPGRGGVGEISDFLFLLAVNRWRPLLDHLSSIPRLHPERLYSVCIELLGELSTFDTERWLKVPLPAYDHHDLARTFRPVIAQLRLALGRPLEQTAIPLPLQDLKHGVRVAVLSDKSLLNTAGFVLAVGAQTSSEALRQRFPAQTKVGPIERLRDLVTLQLPGIGLRPLPVAPRQIPYHAGFTYFELDGRSELWRQLERSGGIGMHVAGDFPGLELEFWAIRQ
jgi:type VI secretion system protein ImpJ